LENKPVYIENGLCFECQRCGTCCNGETGIIYVYEDEITAIAEFLDIDREMFVERCLYPFKDSYSIREDDTGRCIFYENGCAIYPVRPIQCWSFPFWYHMIKSEEAWKEAASKCPGIGKGKRYTKEEITEIMGTTLHLYLVLMKSCG
jgi:Fe-S-cluster containining protein